MENPKEAAKAEYLRWKLYFESGRHFDATLMKNIEQGAKKPATLKNVSDIVYSFGAAYERGILSESSVVDNMVSPLQLLISDLSSGSRTHFDDPVEIQPILAKWVISLKNIFAGVPMETGGQDVMHFIMSHTKRASLVEALLRTGFVKALVEVLPVAAPPLQYSILGCLHGLLLSPCPPGMPSASPLALDKGTCTAIMEDQASMEKLLTFAVDQFEQEGELGQTLGLFCSQTVLMPLFVAHPKHGKPCLPWNVLPAHTANRVEFDFDRVEFDPEAGSFTVGGSPKVANFYAALLSPDIFNRTVNKVNEAMDTLAPYAVAFESVFGQVVAVTKTVRRQSCGCCGASGATQKLLACNRCGVACYCDKACQVKDWKRHKKDCCPKGSGKKS